MKTSSLSRVTILALVAVVVLALFAWIVILAMRYGYEQGAQDTAVAAYEYARKQCQKEGAQARK